MDKTETRAVKKYTHYKDMAHKKTYKDMVEIFTQNLDNTEDDHHPGRPKSTDERVDAVHRMIQDDRRFTGQEIAKFIVISSGLVYTVLTEILFINKMSARWDPKC